MPLPKTYLGSPGDECQCGRRASGRHCPACGSYRIYGYVGMRYHRHLNGELKLTEHVFRCLSCSHMFIDAEREWCEAPVVAGKAKLAAQQIRALREAASRGEPLTDKEQVIKEGVDELLHNSTGAADTVVPLARTAPHDVVRRLMAEWTSHKIRGVNTDKTWQEYVERKLNELGYSVEKETT